MTQVIAPTPDADDAWFWKGVAEDRLLLQRCAECRLLRHPPSPMCSGCNALAWETLPASGRATVYSWVVSRHPTRPDADPRIVVLLDLEEGVRFVSNLVDCPLEDVRFGLPVELVFVDYDGVRLPQFRPARS
ncbi:MAG: OB-fold domain-containing protein [Spirochaetaceae bacterium]|nr:OB-fold domain-containing protein [Myxococcales bacterium]MCB9726307.1 OB-fold domain-containing protein [Spirochaetaceae bacterium]HPG26729.1 OB-fold domain-containing protein [Myxococcota bacterium]